MLEMQILRLHTGTSESETGNGAQQSPDKSDVHPNSENTVLISCLQGSLSTMSSYFHFTITNSIIGINPVFPKDMLWHQCMIHAPLIELIDLG